MWKAAAASLILFLAACEAPAPADPPEVVVPPGAAKQVPAEVRAFFRDADTLELLSLFPYPKGYDEKLWKERGYENKEKAGDYAVLGGMTLTPVQRVEVLTAFYEGIAGNDDTVASCFNPRHALRARKGDDVVIAIICYECLQILFDENGKRVGDALTTKAPGKRLTRLLKSARVTLPDQ